MFEQGQSNKTLSSIEREKRALLQDLQEIKTRSSSFRDGSCDNSFNKSLQACKPSVEESISSYNYRRNIHGTKSLKKLDTNESDLRGRANSFSPTLLRKEFTLQRPHSYSPTLLRKSIHGSETGFRQNRHSDIVQSKSHPLSADVTKPQINHQCSYSHIDAGKSAFSGSDSCLHSSSMPQVSQRRAQLLRKAEHLEDDIIRRQTERGGFMYGEKNAERWGNVRISKYHASVRKPVAAFAMHRPSKVSP